MQNIVRKAHFLCKKFKKLKKWMFQIISWILPNFGKNNYGTIGIALPTSPTLFAKTDGISAWHLNFSDIFPNHPRHPCTSHRQEHSCGSCIALNLWSGYGTQNLFLRHHHGILRHLKPLYLYKDSSSSYNLLKSSFSSS